MHRSTAAVHADEALRDPRELSPPIAQPVNFASLSAEEFRASAGEAFSAEFYTRHGNGNHNQVAAIVAELEGAEQAMVAASGMGAFTTAMLTLVEAGDHVVAQRSHYTGTAREVRGLLPKLGVECTEVDQTQPEAFERAMRPNTKVVLLESPSNPRLEVTDLAAVAEIARRHGALTLADNTFATPINQRPLDLGVDLVWHSATKYMGGHADLLAGVVAGPSSVMERMWDTAQDVGAILAPFAAWLLLRGLRTLPLRMERHNENALALARALEGHDAIKRVYHPGLESDPGHGVASRQMSGFGGVLSMDFEGGHDVADAFLSNLRYVKRAPSLGGVHSVAVQPEAYWTARGDEDTVSEVHAAGIQPGLVRFATGIEHPDDLLEDVMAALEAVEAAVA
jgi:cystathionine beta-lyase/cystathionine gamma-synthase